MKCLGVKKGIKLCSSSAPYISTPRSMTLRIAGENVMSPTICNRLFKTRTYSSARADARCDFFISDLVHPLTYMYSGLI